MDHPRPGSGRLALLLLLPALATACGDAPLLRLEPAPAESRVVAAAHAGGSLLHDVRRVTARYNSTRQAEAHGYLPDDHCVAVPGLGGMGYHWVDPTRIDATYDPLQPEVLLYATGPGGNLRLVAVEYIVLDEGQDAPTFGEQPFDVGGTPVPVPHWSLHVWLFETNPSGLFAPFNPAISCP